MHVIRHQHVRVDRAAIVLGVEPQPVQIEPIILLRVEARRAVVAPLDDEQRHVLYPDSAAAWHARVYRFATFTPSHRPPTGLRASGTGSSYPPSFNRDAPRSTAERAPVGLAVFSGSASKYL